MKNYQKRYRRGWFGDSHRHRLAAQGIASKHYFQVKHHLKGNRRSPQWHEAIAELGSEATDEKIAANPEFFVQEYDLPYEEVQRIVEKQEKERAKELKQLQGTQATTELATAGPTQPIPTIPVGVQPTTATVPRIEMKMTEDEEEEEGMVQQRAQQANIISSEAELDRPIPVLAGTRALKTSGVSPPPMAEENLL